MKQRPSLVQSFGLRLCSSDSSASSTLSEDSSSFARRKLVFEKFPVSGTSKARQAWVESLSASKWVPDSSKVIQLHPDVWAVKPR